MTFVIKCKEMISATFVLDNCCKVIQLNSKFYKVVRQQIAVYKFFFLFFTSTCECNSRRRIKISL